MDVVLGRLGAGHKAGGNGEEERPTERVVILMHKVFQLPSGALCRLVKASSCRLLHCSFCLSNPIKNGH